MRWICPRCGVALSLAVPECPYCPPAATAPKPAEAPPPEAAAPPGAATAKPDAIPKPPPPAAAPPFLPEDSPYLRGVRFGLGFLLVVATVLLLLALLLEWLAAHPEWQPWLGPPGG